MNANRFIEAGNGLMFRHFTPTDLSGFIMSLVKGPRRAYRTMLYRHHIISAEKHNFTESYLGGSPEAHYYGLN